MAIPRYHDERLGRLPEKFFKALGHLQYAFTGLEVQMACIVSQYITVGYDSGIHWPMMNKVDAVLGGMRMDNAKDTINRLLRVSDTPDEVRDFVASIFKQIGEIQYLRNRLTHYHTAAVFRKRGQFINTDAEVAREQSKALFLTFSYDALDAARHDLHAIGGLLDRLFDPDEESVTLQLPAWQYKPSMLTR